MTTHDHDDPDDQIGLHQRAIRELTRVAFELSAASNLATGRVADRIDASVRVLDDVIKDLRRATFDAMTTRPAEDRDRTAAAESTNPTDTGSHRHRERERRSG